MTPANELIQVSPAVRYWQAYDPSVKSDLFSSALQTSEGLLIVDPIALRHAALQELTTGHTIAGIFVTNANHSRSSVDFAEKFGAPIFAHPATCAACDLPSARQVNDGEMFLADVRAIQIAGAAPGELAIHHGAGEEAVMVIGDALINFEPYGFTFLPPKYCSNAKEMRRALRRLLDFHFERMLFAHGTPLMNSARKKLEDLLQANE